ncbi:unnamed protein product, partial [Brenthis ino]
MLVQDIVQPLCVLESDFGFKINCAFKKSGLFRVRNLGGLKAHASLGFSLGDELGFEQSLTNQDPSRRRSVSVKNGAPNILVDTATRPGAKQEKRAKQNRIMMRPMPTIGRPNPAAMDKLSSLHRVSTMPNPTIVDTKFKPAITMAKPMPMGVPPFKPLPPKEETLKVLPLASQAQSKGYPSEKSSDNISHMVSRMTASQYNNHPSKLNPFVPMPSQAISIIPAPVIKHTNPSNQFLDTIPHQVHDLAVYGNTKKNDDYNTISGYSDDVTLQFNKEDINAKIAEIAKAGNISMEAVEAAIALRQQQLLSKYANIPTTTTTTTTTTTESVFQLEPEPEIIVAPVPQKPQKPKRNPTSGKVMNAPREYYPVGYEKNFDDHFQSKVDLPDTSFHCGDQKYFPGLYGDESLGCMVFHVCALTDDGLVMKSFLCPESTLFDQTILKCNWWFYVDCASSSSLYDTNIPVSKSYQLMKALTFFSSYKKAEDGQPSNPEDVDGIKEAITILENQDSKPAASENVRIVTPSPIIDERHNTNNNNNDENNSYPNMAPVYRGTRDYNNETEKRNTRRNPIKTNDEYKLVKVDANINFNNTKSSEKSDSSERKRRRMVSRNNYSKTKPTTTSSTTTTTSTTTQEPSTTSEIIKQDIQPTGNIKQEKLTDQLENLDQIDSSILKEAENAPPVRRFYRSSAERHAEKEITVINNEKVQIIRPTQFSNEPSQNTAKYDSKPYSSRFKKEAVSIVIPTKYRRPIDRS